MRTLYPETIIFSVDQATLSDRENSLSTNQMRAFLTENEIDYKEVVGCYKYNNGEVCKELAFVVTDKDSFEKITYWALYIYKQECILYLDQDRNAYLRYPAYEEKIGKFVTVSKENALNSEAFTFDPATSLYYKAV